MSDVMPKVKLYIALSIIALLVNLGVVLTAMATHQLEGTVTDTSLSDVKVGNVSINTGAEQETETSPSDWIWSIWWWVTGGFMTATGGLASLGLAFIPFASMVPLSLLDIDSNIFIFISIFITIISLVQTLILLFISLQLISNIIYHPDI